MIKCTGKRCPMQVGYDVTNCQYEGCSYRTAPTTNYDRIRYMSVEELANLLDTFDNELPPYCRNRYTCEEECMNCAKQWLESEVTEE